MVASTTPPNTETALPRRCIAVAYSGGRDSTALLHATLRMAAALNETLNTEAGQRALRLEADGDAPVAPLHVCALHVHHGLSFQADDWLAHARMQCEAWAAEGLPVSLDWRCLSLRPPAGASVEAVAREARYLALAEMARNAGCEAVLLAHHQRDQAETFLLQALRCAGAAGLAAMPAQNRRLGVSWLRPWLSFPREHIEAYVACHGLRHVDDDSNDDPRFARNRLRLQVWPALTQAFEGVEEHLAQAASHQADLKACLDEWLAHTLPKVTLPTPDGLVLDVSAWLACRPGPRRELLRAWFGLATGVPLPLSGVRRVEGDLLRKATAPGSGAETAVTIKGSARWPWPCAARAAVPQELVLYRGLLQVRAVPSDSAPSQAAAPELAIVAVGDTVLPDGWGVLSVTPVDQGGVALRTLSRCRLQRRTGGEQFQLAPGRPARSLKKQFQQLGVPAWARQGPLLYVGDRLVFVPGLGIDARVRADTGEPQVDLRWHAAPACAEIGGNTDQTDIAGGNQAPRVKI